MDKMQKKTAYGWGSDARDTAYEKGLVALDTAIVDPQDRAILEPLMTALRANLSEARTFGSTPAIREARVALVRQLNQFAFDNLGRSFNELFLYGDKFADQSSPYGTAFAQLRSFLPQDEPAVWLDVLDLEHRLWAAINFRMRYGNNERIRCELVDVLTALDRVARTFSQEQFTDWLPETGPHIPTVGASSERSDDDSPNKWRELSAYWSSHFAAGIRALEAHCENVDGLEQLHSLADALRHNLQTMSVQGDTEENRNECLHLLYELDNLAYELTGKTYKAWCPKLDLS